MAIQRLEQAQLRPLTNDIVRLDKDIGTVSPRNRRLKLVRKVTVRNANRFDLWALRVLFLEGANDLRKRLLLTT